MDRRSVAVLPTHRRSRCRAYAIPVRCTLCGTLYRHCYSRTATQRRPLRPKAQWPRSLQRQRRFAWTTFAKQHTVASCERDELAPLHPITSSASASSLSGFLEAERLGSLEVDDQFELDWLLDWQMGGLLAVENLPNVGCRLVK